MTKMIMIIIIIVLDYLVEMDNKKEYNNATKTLTLINKDRANSQQSECILEYSYLSIFLKMKIDRFNLIVMKLLWNYTCFSLLMLYDVVCSSSILCLQNSLNSYMRKAVFDYSSVFPIGFEDDYYTATTYYILTIFLLVYHLYMK